MRLHLLVGCRELLLPLPLDPETVAGLIGPRVRVATAFWLWPNAGLAYHDFLRQPGDRQLEVFGLSLRENFGTRHEPLVVLPGLLDETRTAGDLLGRLWAAATPSTLVLHAVALPAAADPEGCWGDGRHFAPAVEARLAVLAASGAIPADRIQTRLILAQPEAPAFAPLWRNAVADRLAEAMQPLLSKAGLALDRGRAGTALVRLLAAWAGAGVAPATSLTGRHLAGLAERALPVLLERAAAGVGDD